ncbi:hypothetical protein [Hoeflea prorocentri]|uniref:Uncharacterized protein n=1 Tax=Hoeflea prorocentri TaxID=1922333 RepID=A0A9X3UKH4_9HYPH|nr:hypothetical protein [Hoeflea prorocentri]MCY6382207.1 hypothetical protein [Hoeflea prorocentri]MDA5400007.1 hypothetical protein [Hoeflea prorocentri]
MKSDLIVLILGSAPDAMRAAIWPKPEACKIVSVNNAWRVRDDWDYNIFPDDFPSENWPDRVGPGQTVITSDSYVPANNQYGGIVYAGATMAFNAGYWALSALKPRVLAYLGCDMVYEGQKTHFYGQGEPDPLREDVTLSSLEAKSARLMTLAARQHCACVNLSEKKESRLLFPRVSHKALSTDIPIPGYDPDFASRALGLEQEAGYLVEDGRYWEHDASFDPAVLATIDELWMSAV